MDSSLFIFKLSKLMEQLSQNVTVIRYPDPMIMDNKGAIKILLAGSASVGQNDAYDWQNKFIQGLIQLADPTPGSKTGIMMFSKLNYIVIDPRTNASNPAISLDNPEFVQGFSYFLDMVDVADAIFLNFLKRSTAPTGIFDLGYLIRSGKTVVRCPEEYFQSGFVNFLCQRYNVPLLPGRQGTVLSVLQSMFAFCQNIQQQQQYQLPE
jgi:hypothetical protein